MERFSVVDGTGRSFCGIFDSEKQRYSGLSSATDSPDKVRKRAEAAVKGANSNTEFRDELCSLLKWLSPEKWFDEKEWNGE